MAGKMEFGPGTVFAGYRLESLAGRGGMGVVYRATEQALGRPVALKVMAP
jgi:serine/threonine-protein kinase